MQAARRRCKPVTDWFHSCATFLEIRFRGHVDCHEVIQCYRQLSAQFSSAVEKGTLCSSVDISLEKISEQSYFVKGSFRFIACMFAELIN